MVYHSGKRTWFDTVISVVLVVGSLGGFYLLLA